MTRNCMNWPGWCGGVRAAEAVKRPDFNSAFVNRICDGFEAYSGKIECVVKSPVVTATSRIFALFGVFFRVNLDVYL